MEIEEIEKILKKNLEDFAKKGDFKIVNNQVVDIHGMPICPTCIKPMKLDKKNSSKYNKLWYCCDLMLSEG